MELIPALKRQRYRYVLVDSEHVEAVTPMGWDELRYRPHVAQFGSEEIIVVVRDRELSNAQEAGMDADWFIHEVAQRTRLDEISQAIYAARRNATGISARDPDAYWLLEEAHWRVLRAEASCNFFWGDAWLQRCHHDLDRATDFLDQAGSHLTGQ